MSVHITSRRTVKGAEVQIRPKSSSIQTGNKGIGQSQHNIRPNTGHNSDHKKS